ncbi:extracellular solute-binding protein [Microtetraspora sp. NBRC 16547]|uniref:extracellular solute-binding protein n=1 Tax=Microtetraspora sp. NBRC 16547 TaxID=3030993 RepID=UPI0024A57D08|nr:extracellular solute-binding protein [Microtetraspora sp. NBRC 16547]GLW96897.1 ABC transporter [Microtetraspora sp. NBRC 16547]
MRAHRSLAAAVAGILGLTTLAACGSDSAGDGKSLTFVAYGGVTQDVMVKQWLEPWGKTEGVTVSQDSPTDYAKLATMVEAGKVTWDLVDTEPFYPIQECGKSVVKLDHTGIDVDKLPKGTVSDCALPIWGYSLLLAYNKDKYGANPPTSFADFFDLAKFPGTRAAPANVTAGPLEVGLLADGVEPSALYPLDIPRALKKWDALKGKVNLWKTSSVSQQQLEAKQADMALVWSGRAAEAVKNGAPYAPVWKQNLFSWASVVIPKGSAHVKEAQSAIRSLLTPETQAKLAENIAYAPVNSAADPKLDQVYAAYNVTSPTISEQSVSQDAVWWAENQQQAVTQWTAWTTS